MKEQKKTFKFIKPKEENWYYQQNPVYFDDLVELVENHPSKYSLILNKKGKKRERNKVPEYKYLNEWINDITKDKLGDSFYSTPTKCFWILNDIHDFPKCIICGNQEWFKTRNVKLWTGYYSTCSIKCKQNTETSKENRRQTCLKLYGCENTFQSEEKKCIAYKTKLRRYGDGNFRNGEKISETKRQKAAEDPEYKNKIQQKRETTTMRRFGVRNAAMSSSIARRTRRKYDYDGLMFDSQAEIAFYIWAIENGRRIVRATTKFTFIYNGKEYGYFPDFYDLDAQRYIELKGDQFFNKDGILYLPWKPKQMSDTAYMDICARFAEKQKYMESAGVLMLKWSSDEVQHAIKYVNTKYGKHYLEQFRYNGQQSKQ